MKTIVLAILASLPVFAVGTVGVSINALGPQQGPGGLPENRVHVITITWVGDSVNGTVPATVINVNQFPQLSGYRLTSMEVQPGTPNPSGGYSITLVDSVGVDLLQSLATNLSATASLFNGSIVSPPLSASPTFNLSGNSVASARGTILLYLAPLTGVTTATQLPPNLALNNTFTGTNIFTGTTLTQNLNTVLYVGGAEPQIGASADMGAQINAAYALLPSTGGTIVVLPQTGGNCYNFSTPITFNVLGKYILLQGNAPVSLNNGSAPSGGTCLNYTPTTATTAITLDYTPTTGGGYIPGSGIRDLTLTNNACGTNGGCGSLATGIKTGTTNGGAHKADFSNVRISGFGTGLNLADVGGPSWGMQFRNFSVSWNTTGWLMTTLHENLDWIGGACAVNTTCFSDSTGTSINVFGVSFDSNITVAVTGNAIFSCYGCYSENLNQAAFQLATVTGGVFSWINSNVVNDNNSGTLTRFITSTAGQVNFDSNINSAGQTVTNILDNSGGGTGDISWSTPNPTLIASACATPTFCFSRQRAVSGQPPRIATPSLLVPADTVGVGGIANATACRHNAANNFLQCSYNNGTFFQIPQVITATSAAFATATTAGTCVQNTTAVTGATTSMAVTVAPNSTPGVGAVWSGFVSSAGNVTINECAVATSAGGTIAFNIRVTP